MTVAKFVVSFDFELGWGAIENGRWKKREKDGVYRRMRQDIPSLLEILDTFDVPVTWAFVGAMVDAPGDRQLEHLPEPIKARTEDFIRSAEQTTIDGRDLFDSIRSRQVKHALSCHSYSHVRFDYDGVNGAFIEREMALFRAVCEKQNVSVETIVFPQNIEGYYSEISRNGIITARTAAKTGENRSTLSKLLLMLSKPPPLSVNETDVTGVLRHSGSMFFNSGPGRMHRLPVVLWQAVNGVNHAIKEGGTFHIWIHPFNLSESTFLLTSFVKILEYVCAKRDKGLIEIAPFV